MGMSGFPHFNPPGREALPGSMGYLAHGLRSDRGMLTLR